MTGAFWSPITTSHGVHGARALNCVIERHGFEATMALSPGPV